MPKAAVVLAAGSSSRLGSPKQLAEVGGERLLERAVRVALEAGCEPVIVVLGCGAEEIAAQCSLSGARVVVNQDWAEGMGSSVRMGVAGAQGAEGVVLLTCDQPAVTAAHLQLLVKGGEVTASSYAGRRGVPAFFPATWFPRLLDLQGDAGARGLLASARLVALSGGELDVDTAESLAVVQQIFDEAKE